MKNIKEIIENKCISKNHITGYTKSEIVYIEELYHFKASGGFGEFLEFCGKNSGGAINSNTFILYRKFSVKEFFYFQEKMKCNIVDLAYDPNYSKISQEGAIIFSVEDDNFYFFVRTKGTEQDIVHCYDHKKNERYNTGMTFNEYVKSVIERYPNTTGRIDNGNLLPFYVR